MVYSSKRIHKRIQREYQLTRRKFFLAHRIHLLTSNSLISLQFYTLATAPARVPSCSTSSAACVSFCPVSVCTLCYTHSSARIGHAVGKASIMCLLGIPSSLALPGCTWSELPSPEDSFSLPVPHTYASSRLPFSSIIRSSSVIPSSSCPVITLCG